MHNQESIEIQTKMATSASVDKTVDDLLICTICLETFKVPKYLLCLHTFCETCIHTYILWGWGARGWNIL